MTQLEHDILACKAGSLFFKMAIRYYQATLPPEWIGFAYYMKFLLDSIRNLLEVHEIFMDMYGIEDVPVYGTTP